MLIFISVTFFVCLSWGYLSINYNVSKWEQKIFVFIILALLVLAAGFRSSQYLDYINYKQGFYTGVENFEITFNVIRFIAQQFSFRDYHWLFLIYAILGVSAKYIAIKKISPLLYYSLAIYISYFYILHELIQIRAGVAAGICLLSTKYIYERKLLLFIFLVSIASLFHTSAVLYFPLFFLETKKISKIKWLLIFVCFTIVFGIVSPNIDVLSNLLPTERMQSKIVAYELSASKGHIEELNVFSIFNIFYYLLLAIFFIFVDRLRKHNQYFCLLLKIFIIGILFNFAFYNWIPTLAIRGFEMYTVTSIILIPTLYYITHNRFIGTFIVFLVGVAYIIIILFRGYIPQ